MGAEFSALVRVVGVAAGAVSASPRCDGEGRAFAV